MSRSSNSTLVTRWIAVAMAAGLLVGCGKKEEATETPAETGGMPAAESPAPAAPAAEAPATAAPETSPAPAAPTGAEGTTGATGTTGGAADTTGAAGGATGAAGAAAGGGTQTASAGGDAEALMKQSDCFSCHSVDQKMVGPAYAWVAYKYKGQKDADVKLAQKIKAGGAGNWNALTGGVPMPPHPQLTDAQAKAMADWVLKQKPVEPPKA
ncbi:MAG: c-type cytochrome [Pseudomonadota bacterium]